MNELDLLFEPLEVVKQRMMDTWPPAVKELSLAIARQDFRDHASIRWAVSPTFHDVWNRAARRAGWVITWKIDSGGYYLPQWSRLP